MLIDSQRLQERLSSPGNILSRANSRCKLRESSKQGPGRAEGDKNIPPNTRALIGVAARLVGPGKASEMFGVSGQTAGNYSKGMVGDKKDDELTKRVEGKAADLRDKAANIADHALNNVTESKIKRLGAKDSIKVASEAAKIVGKLGPKGPGEGARNTQINFYTPIQRNIEEYEVVKTVE